MRSSTYEGETDIHKIPLTTSPTRPCPHPTASSNRPRQTGHLGKRRRAAGVWPAAVPGAACDAVTAQCWVGSY